MPNYATCFIVISLRLKMMHAQQENWKSTLIQMVHWVYDACPTIKLKTYPHSDGPLNYTGDLNLTKGFTRGEKNSMPTTCFPVEKPQLVQISYFRMACRILWAVTTHSSHDCYALCQSFTILYQNHYNLCKDL